MGHAVPRDLGRNRKVVFRSAPIGAYPDLCQMVQSLENDLTFDAEVDQGSHFGHAHGLDLGHPVECVFDGAEQARAFEVALEGKVEDGVQFVFLEPAQIDLVRAVHPFGPFEGRKGPGVLLDEGRRRAQVVLHRGAGDVTRLFAILSKERVQHQRDVEIFRIMPRLAQGRVIEADLLADLVDALTQEMGQDVGADPTGLDPGVGIARGGDPDRQLFRDRARLG